MPLPDYANPPVVETVLGVQFDRLPKLKNGHLGAFWRSLNHTEWPTTADAPPLGSQFEQFTGASRWARAIQLQLMQDPSFRIQIKSADATRMIQLQNSRLHFNWIRAEGGEYPRYDAVRREFQSVLDRFKDFVVDGQLGELRPNQWEVTYVNQIPVGTVWQSPADWGFFSPLAGLATIEGLIQGESFGGEWHFVIPDQRGRLHINWQHGKAMTGRASEPTEAESIRLDLTARGPFQPNEVEPDNVLAGLDVGHEAIVVAFARMMSPDANRYWGLRNAGNN